MPAAIEEMQSVDEPQARVPLSVLVHLLETLELAARRGAFELEEYLRVGGVFKAAQACRAEAER
jgi:hypothetical protein